MKCVKRAFVFVVTIAIVFCGTIVTSATDYNESLYKINEKRIIQPTNPDATKEAKNLYKYLCGMLDTKDFVTGSFDDKVYWDKNKFDASKCPYDRVEDEFGIAPGLYSSRLPYTSDAVCDYQEVNGVLTDKYNQGAILMIHDEALLGRSVRDIAEKKGIKDSGSPKALRDMMQHLDETNPNRDMDVYNTYIAAREEVGNALQDLEKRGVKAYMYRVFVEMDGDSMGHCYTEEGYQAFKNVWRQLWTYLFKERHIKGCLLTYSPCGGQTTTQNYYPGDEYVDVLSSTVYSGGGRQGWISPYYEGFSDYSWYVETGKPIGISELGVRHGQWSTVGEQPVGDWHSLVQSLNNYFPAVTWVNCWNGGPWSLNSIVKDDKTTGNYNGALFLNNPFAVNRNNLPDFSIDQFDNAGMAVLYSQKDFKGSSAGLYFGEYSENDLQNLGVSATNALSCKINSQVAVTFYEEDNCSGKNYTYQNHIRDISGQSILKNFKSISVKKVDNIALDKPVLASTNTNDAWKAVDGSESRWTTDEGADSWVALDLQDNYTISRWKVRHAEAAREAVNYNTVDYELQYSTDMENWATVDEVKNNIYAETNRNLPSFTARFVRIHITTPNKVQLEGQQNIATIMELELYGVISASSDTDINKTVTMSMNDSSLQLLAKQKQFILNRKALNNLTKKESGTPFVKIIVALSIVAVVSIVIYFVLTKRRKKYEQSRCSYSTTN